jgi:hypothetical protein
LFASRDRQTTTTSKQQAKRFPSASTIVYITAFPPPVQNKTHLCLGLDNCIIAVTSSVQVSLLLQVGLGQLHVLGRLGKEVLKLASHELPIEQLLVSLVQV